MVSFSCEVCNDTVLKKKLQQHQYQCRGSYFTCIDCSTTFYGNDHVKHTSCISEAEKYEKGLYKGKKQGKTQPAKKVVKEVKEVKETKVEPKVEPKVEKAKTDKPKKAEVDFKKYISNEPTSLYKIFKSAKKDHKSLADKADFLKNVKVTQGKDGSLSFTL